MQLVTRALRYLTHRYLAEPHRANLNTARANAAEAHAVLQERRREREEVDDYVARLWAYYDADETNTRQG
jgi:hypothetical protein